MKNADGLGGAVSDNVDYCPWVTWPKPWIAYPQAITEPATDVGTTTVRLWGVVEDDGGEACQYRFRYKKEGDRYYHLYWWGSVTTGQSFNWNLSDLSPGCRYYFSAQVRNTASASLWGNEESFITLPEAGIAVLLLAPNGSEEIVAGSTYEIIWETTGTMESVLIEYSTNNGTGWTTIDTIGNTGSYEWEVPNANSQECLVRVSCPGRPSVNDTSDDVFTIFQCSGIIPGDSNGDCYVNFLDFAATAECWLNCGNPFDPDCQPL